MSKKKTAASKRKKAVRPARRKANGLEPITILTRFELKSVRLIESNSSVDLKAGGLPKIMSIELETGLGVSTDEQAVKVNCKCCVESKYVESDSEPAIQICCEYQTVYKFTGDTFPTSDELSDAGGDITNAAVIQTWPFIRHFVFWTSTQIGVPPITLPMFRTETPSGLVGSIRSENVAAKK